MNKDCLIECYKRKPIDFVSGHGAILVDDNGKSYIDLLSGIAVCGLGHTHPKVNAAIQHQLTQLIHVSNHFGNSPMRKLAQQLVKTTGGWGRVFFANSGAEANECAIKLARKFGAGEKYQVLAAQGGFHGRTLATLAATGQPEKWKGFAPLPEGFKHLPYNDLAAFEQAMSDKVAAILVEPIQGERGVIPADPQFLKGLRSLATDYSIPLIFDEVQTGMGRTGCWWAFQHFNVKPDIITSAKGLANGLPIGACIADEPFASAFKPGDHGSTFGGGALVCAAALAVIEATEKEDLLQQSLIRGSYLTQKLKVMTGIEAVRGVGMMQAAVLTAPVAHQVVSQLLTEGVILNATSDSVLRFLPPLIISESLLDQALLKIEKIIQECIIHAS